MKVRYYGHVGAQTGYGIAGEHLCRTLLAAGIDLEIRPLMPFHRVVVNPDDVLYRHLRTDRELARNPDATIVHTIPPDLPSVLSALEREGRLDEVKAGKLVSYTTLDYANEKMPQEHAHQMRGPTTRQYDEAWFPCQKNVRQAAHAGLTAWCMPHGFDVERARRRRAEPAPPHDPGEFVFFYVGAWSDRKNPQAVVDAFTQEFTLDEPVRLVLRTDVPLEHCGPHKARVSGIGPLPEPELNRWYRDVADCFVSAPRMEAFNLPAFEAMLSGRYIITTMGVGSDDYLSGTDARRLPAFEVPMTIGGRTSPWAIWYDPLVLYLRVTMREVFATKRRTLYFDKDPAETYGYETLGALARHRLEGITR